VRFSLNQPGLAPSPSHRGLAAITAGIHVARRAPTAYVAIGGLTALLLLAFGADALLGAHGLRLYGDREGAAGLGIALGWVWAGCTLARLGRGESWARALAGAVPLALVGWLLTLAVMFRSRW
jgi:hypothetical protein